jgi:hypothetical protein
MDTNNIISLVVGFALGFAVSWFVFSPAKVDEVAVEAPVEEVTPAVPADATTPSEPEVVPLPPQETVDPAPAEAPKAAN